ncbi:MAG TPA: ABC transporter permease, partial [Arthrobacter sp.]|nr:ABC transporter permease [Arthrobacter sp.]
MTLTATAPVSDERVAKKSTLSKLLGRPEIGALVGAVALFIFFAAVAPVFLQPGSIATVLYGASTIGIMAVGVSLLMIGGEF